MKKGHNETFMKDYWIIFKLFTFFKKFLISIYTHIKSNKSITKDPTTSTIPVNIKTRNLTFQDGKSV